MGEYYTNAQLLRRVARAWGKAKRAREEIALGKRYAQNDADRVINDHREARLAPIFAAYDRAFADLLAYQRGEDVPIE
jgi:hypothetical protein